MQQNLISLTKWYLARTGSRTLQLLRPTERATIISTIAQDLLKRKEEILKINKIDLEKANANGIKGPMYDRLVLTDSKLESLAKGLHQIAERSHENVDRTLRRTKISDTLNLVQKTVPIGSVWSFYNHSIMQLNQLQSLFRSEEERKARRKFIIYFLN